MARFDGERFPSRKSFEAAAERGNLVALSVAINFDHETPIGLAARFGDRPNFFLLESASAGPASVARYSFIGFDKLWTLTTLNGKTQVDYADGQSIHMTEPNPVLSLRSTMQSYQFAWANSSFGAVNAPPCPGPVGYFSYDIARFIEPTIGASPRAGIGLAETHYVLAEKFLIFDHLFRQLTVSILIDVDRHPSRLKAFDRGMSELQKVLDKLMTPVLLKPMTSQYQAPDFSVCQASMSQDDFFAAADKCLDFISKGDAYQLQIGNRLSMATTADPLDVFRFLRMLNPSPYMFFYRFDGHTIFGSSPEMMVQVEKQAVTQRPIAGTRKRTWNYQRDLEMRRELAESEKERSEHVMLVDLSRNDIGRIALAGSVVVDELMMIEEYSHVFHMVSQVSGRLRPQFDAFDAMIASFPNGTVCGAPKVKAMQIISQLEPCRREFYAGSLAMFGFDATLRSTILIRTIHMANGWASTQASAGFVYDSIPEQEWQETRNKMAACVAAIQCTT